MPGASAPKVSRPDRSGPQADTEQDAGDGLSDYLAQPSQTGAVASQAGAVRVSMSIQRSSLLRTRLQDNQPGSEPKVAIATFATDSESDGVRIDRARAAAASHMSAGRAILPDYARSRARRACDTWSCTRRWTRRAVYDERGSRPARSIQGARRTYERSRPRHPLARAPRTAGGASSGGTPQQLGLRDCRAYTPLSSQSGPSQRWISPPSRRRSPASARGGRTRPRARAERSTQSIAVSARLSSRHAHSHW